MSEKNIMRRIMLALGGLPQVRLFRNNIGVAKHDDGSRTEYGLCVGSSDLIGWKSIEVTPEMVGKRIAVFTAIEVKSPTNNRLSPAQLNFLKVVQDHGGIAGVAKSDEEALNLIK